MTKSRVTAKKYEGDDSHSWAVFIDGKPFVTGLTKSEVPYYKKVAAKRLVDLVCKHCGGDGGVNCRCVGSEEERCEADAIREDTENK
jgi:hypothetical protein